MEWMRLFIPTALIVMGCRYSVGVDGGTQNKVDIEHEIPICEVYKDEPDKQKECVEIFLEFARKYNGGEECSSSLERSQ